jgi:hypothetical protein
MAMPMKVLNSSKPGGILGYLRETEPTDMEILSIVLKVPRQMNRNCDANKGFEQPKSQEKI